MATLVKIEGLDRASGVSGSPTGGSYRGFKVPSGLGQAYPGGAKASLTVGDAGDVQATGTLTAANNTLSTNTVVIGGRTYTFRASASSPDDVKVGTSADDSLLNLSSAINLGPGVGDKYGTGTLLNDKVVAAPGTTGTLVLTAWSGNPLYVGDLGNAITTVGTGNLSFGHGTLENGVTGDLNEAVTVTAKMGGAVGNKIHFAITVSAGDKPLSVYNSIGASTGEPYIEVIAATTGGVATTTAAQAAAAINSDPVASRWVTATYSGTGADVVVDGNMATLANGTDSGTSEAFYVKVDSSSVAIVDVDDAKTRRILRRHAERYTSSGAA